MIKKFNKEYGVTLILFLICAFCVWFGYCIGHTAAETEAARQTEATTPVTSVNITPAENEKTTAPEYTELTVTATAYCHCEKCCGKN